MFKNIQVFVCILCAFNFIQFSSSETPVRKCFNGEPKPLSVQVDSCTAMPCKLRRGFSSNIAIQFVSNKDSLENIRSEIILSTLGIRMPLNLQPQRTNVCRNLMYDAYCPMDKGEDATYRLVLHIGKHQPEVPIALEVSIRDASDQSILACFILDARITNRISFLAKYLI